MKDRIRGLCSEFVGKKLGVEAVSWWSAKDDENSEYSKVEDNVFYSKSLGTTAPVRGVWTMGDLSGTEQELSLIIEAEETAFSERNLTSSSICAGR